MPAEHDTVTLDGHVTDLFGHRFVLATEAGKVLADLGPKAAQAVTLAVGDRISISGQRTPSEVKVHSLVRDGRTVAIRSADGDTAREVIATAVEAVRAAGFEPVGEPKPKPKHVEVVGRQDGELIEFHVGPDGDIRKRKPVASSEPKA